MEPPARRNPVWRYLSRFEEGEVLRWAFRGLLIGAIGVLALDLRELAALDDAAAAIAPEPDATFEPVLPPVSDTDGPNPPSDPRQFVTADEESLRQAMRFQLEPGGVLSAIGTIDLGSAKRFAAELEARGEYVTTVTLNSPGGTLSDAMAMGAAIRELGLGTRVVDGALCASSCPLLFAGGATREAGAQAAIGVHQFYAVTGEAAAPGQAMSDAQKTTARITRHLSDLGVDPALWLHALDTPPRSLYYLSRQQMADYRLITDAGSVAAGRQQSPTSSGSIR